MVSEKVLLSGHIIDSLILPKVLDEIMDLGGAFAIEEIHVGRTRRDTSRACIEVSAPGRDLLDRILERIKRQGAVSVEPGEVKLARASRDGVLPEGFYSSTNLQTDVQFKGRWIRVRNPEMDCAVVVDTKALRARTVPMSDIRKGDRVVVGEQGVRVVPEKRTEETDEFRFMRSRTSSEKPKEIMIHEIAAQMKSAKRHGGKILVVGGPAIVHTGAGHCLEKLIRKGFVDVLFAGNALAVHDVEYALFETSLGIYLDRGQSAEGGHGHHVRAINAIRAAGGLRKAVAKGLLKKGVMYTCIQEKVPFVLAGSIRDDGPLPEVITDIIEAQRAMRRHLKGVRFALMVATTLHSIAVGNLLPASVRTVCVDINPSVVTKLIDRGSFQAAGVVTDAELFLRELSHILTGSRAG
jgi:lysine-ketoglutarate reductase/saccharopine dehydrogenase-like protein (TIGR00300 family)